MSSTAVLEPVVVRDDPRPTDTVVAPRLPARGRRAPLPVVVAGTLAVLEAVGLLALGLTSLDELWSSGLRPPGELVVLTLLLLAGWVVACAGGGASLLDGAGRRLLVSVATGEIVLLSVVGAAGVLTDDGVLLVDGGPLTGLPVPALALLALAVPTGKLLLAGTPAALAWAAGAAGAAAPRPGPRGTAPGPTARRAEHGALRVLTVAAIGCALTAVALAGG